MRCPPRPELMAEKIAYSPETLIKAYALGVFPMADGANSPDIHFYDPDMQMDTLALARWGAAQGHLVLLLDNFAWMHTYKLRKLLQVHGAPVIAV